MLNRWRLILRYLPPYRAAVALGVASLVFANAFQVLAPLAFREGVKLVEHSTGRIDYARVAGWAGISVLLAAAGGVGAFFKRNVLMRVSRRLETDLRRDFFRHLHRLPRSFFDRYRTGDLLSRATADIEAARMAVGPGTMYLTDALTRFGFALTAMLLVNPRLTSWALLPLGGIAGGLFLLAPRLHKVSREVQDQLAALSARAQESFAGARVVKTFAIEGRESDRMEDISREYLRINVRYARVRGAMSAFLGLLGAAGIAVILLVGGKQAARGEFDVGGLLLFQAYQIMLTWPMMAFGWVLTMIERGGAGLDRLREVMEAPEEAGAEGTGAPVRGEIEVRDLSFGYDGRRVLEGVSVRVAAGETLGVVGPTGCGKSTLVSLLARIYDPPRGSVFLDGRDIHDVPLPTLRGGIGFVPQEAFLFSATIRDNISFGRPDADEATIGKAARDAHLSGDVESFPNGLDTMVGERGVTLSGGQKQRTALARALATDAPILILDDALSAVDAETEAAILHNLRSVRRGRTVVIVAHRVSAVRDADRILVLSQGRVAESGTHVELMARNGPYARMARAQEIEAEIEAME